MKLRPLFLQSTLLSSALALTACGGDGARLSFRVVDSGTGSQSLPAQAQALEPILPYRFQSSDGVTFFLNEARIHLRDIRLDLPQGTKCEEVRDTLHLAECKGGDSGSGSGTLVIPGPIVVDLMTGGTTPDLSELRIPAGTYKRIDFRLEEAKADEVAANEPLVGYSFLASASFADGNQKRLELKLKFSEDARFESATGVEVSSGDALMMMLRPSVWLEGLPLGACMAKGDVTVDGPSVTIDDQAKGDCSDAENTVKNNIKRSGGLRTVD